MAQPFLGEIRAMSFDFPPNGWALCNGQLLPISQNQALFTLLGTTFGGDGTTDFALPDLQGRTPMHVGGGHAFGEEGGEQAHTLSIAALAAHTHEARAVSNAATTPIPTAGMLATASSDIYGASTSLTAFNAGTISNAGGSQAHPNMQPFATLSFCIALQGVTPSST